MLRRPPLRDTARLDGPRSQAVKQLRDRHGETNPLPHGGRGMQSRALICTPFSVQDEQVDAGEAVIPKRLRVFARSCADEA